MNEGKIERLEAMIEKKEAELATLKRELITTLHKENECNIYKQDITDLELDLEDP